MSRLNLTDTFQEYYDTLRGFADQSPDGVIRQVIAEHIDIVDELLDESQKLHRAKKYKQANMLLETAKKILKNNKELQTLVGRNLLSKTK